MWVRVCKNGFGTSGTQALYQCGCVLAPCYITLSYVAGSSVNVTRVRWWLPFDPFDTSVTPVHREMLRVITPPSADTSVTPVQRFILRVVTPPRADTSVTSLGFDGSQPKRYPGYRFSMPRNSRRVQRQTGVIARATSRHCLHTNAAWQRL